MKPLTVIAVTGVMLMTTQVASGFEITPTCLMEKLPQTENVLMCSLEGNAEYYIDNKIVGAGCGLGNVKAPRIWNYRQDPWTGRTQTIITVGWGLNQYFFVVPKYITDKCRRKWH